MRPSASCPSCFPSLEHPSQVCTIVSSSLSPVASWLLAVPHGGWCSAVHGRCSPGISTTISGRRLAVHGRCSPGISTTISGRRSAVHARRLAASSTKPAHRSPFGSLSSVLRTAGSKTFPVTRSSVGSTPFRLFPEEFSNHGTHIFDGFFNDHRTEHLGRPHCQRREDIGVGLGQSVLLRPASDFAVHRIL